MENKPKYTPGPWAIGEDYGRLTIYGAETDGKFPKVAEWVYNCNLSKPKTLDANAALIAAAPDLLEAARNTVAYYAAIQPDRKCLYDELNPCGGLSHWGGKDIPACPLCSARAAIAKAERGTK